MGVVGGEDSSWRCMNGRFPREKQAHSGSLNWIDLSHAGWSETFYQDVFWKQKIYNHFIIIEPDEAHRTKLN